MELRSFEFGSHLFLPIYSRTIVIDRYSVFTALEEDDDELGVMSKFYYWNENNFCISTTVCDLHEVILPRSISPSTVYQLLQVKNSLLQNFCG